jgi:hypothetical protein
MLVGDQHLVDEAVAQEVVVGVGQLSGFEDVEGALADLADVVAELVAAQDRQLVAGLARVLDRIVDPPELAVGGIAPADALNEPELLEVGDVAEIPSQRAEDRRVDRVELLLGERLDQEQGPLPRLLEAIGDPFAQIGLRGRRDTGRLPGRRGRERKKMGNGRVP